MTRFLFIGLAGALGTWCRYLVAVGAAKALGTAFPYGTLVVNVVGCFFMGAVAQVAISTSSLPETTRLVLTTGFLGGFTTYSAFNQETTVLLRDRGLTHAAVNLGLTPVGCCLAGLLGTLAARRFAGA